MPTRKNLGKRLELPPGWGEAEPMRTNRTSTCRVCQTRRVPSANQNPDAHGLELCGPCLIESELENEHSDYGHDEPVKGCPFCGLAGPAPKTIASAPKAVSQVRGDNGLHKCEGCAQELPSKRFPTKKNRDGEYVRDVRVCRRCKR